MQRLSALDWYQTMLVKLPRVGSFVAIWLVLLGTLSMLAPTSAKAQTAAQPASWYRYQG
ncbi:MAG: hypothetical protein AVDCRST_MAG93-1502, partial [uncultured Chloroflexia bacterium]